MLFSGQEVAADPWRVCSEIEKASGDYSRAERGVKILARSAIINKIQDIFQTWNADVISQ
jgi:hypothetical protein